MESQEKLNVRRYFYRFDQILNEMENKMLSVRFSNNITLNFIKCMIPHHQAAIYMCQNLLEYTKYPPLQEIARNIIKTQTRGIEQMTEIARTTSGFNNSPKDINNYIMKYLSITKEMVSKMRNSCRGMDINLNFVSEMIPHHEGAIAMCENLLQYCIDSRLRSVANSIIKEQSEGVKDLEQIRENLCSKENQKMLKRN